MQAITAMIHPFLLSRVTSALESIDGFSGMTILDVSGFRHKRSAPAWQALTTDQFKKQVFIEIVAPDSQAQQIIETLMSAVRTEHSGAGQVLIYPIESAVYIQKGTPGDGHPEAILTLHSFNDFRIFQLARNRER